MRVSELDTLIRNSSRPDAVRRSDVAPGDRILVKTRNSWYTIQALGTDLYSVSGGWFDHQGGAPATLNITGCTWGGHAVNTEILASKGLFLEFGNQVTTTRIEHVCVVRSALPSLSRH